MISIFLSCQVLLLDPHIMNSDDTDTDWLNPTHRLTQSLFIAFLQRNPLLLHFQGSSNALLPSVFQS
jgi:hypothetical protein